MGDLLFCIFVDGGEQTLAHLVHGGVVYLAARGGRIAAAAELFHDELHVDLATKRPVPPRAKLIKEIASRCGVDYITVRNWVHGLTTPANPENVPIISEITGIREEDLFEKQVTHGR